MVLERLISGVSLFILAAAIAAAPSPAAASPKLKHYLLARQWSLGGLPRKTWCGSLRSGKVLAFTRLRNGKYIHVLADRIQAASLKANARLQGNGRYVRQVSRLKRQQRRHDAACRAAANGSSSSSSSGESSSMGSELSCAEKGLAKGAVGISGVRAAAITSSSAVITWATSDCATSEVEYGLNTNYGNSTPRSTEPRIQHQVFIQGLSADTLYHFRVKSENAPGDESVTGDHRFRTQFNQVTGSFDETFDSLDFIDTETLQSVEVASGTAEPRGTRAGQMVPDTDTAALFRLESDPSTETPSLYYSATSYFAENSANGLNVGLLLYPQGHEVDEYITSTSGKYGRAFALNGGRLSVPLPLLSVKDIRLSGLSYSAWIKWDRANSSSEGGTSLIFREYSASISFQIDQQKHLRFNYCNHDSGSSACTDVKGVTEVTTGLWHHVAAAYDPVLKEARIYLDGALQAKVGNAVPIGELTGVLQTGIGGVDSSTSYSFKGSIDDAAVLTRPISDAEAADLYNGGLSDGISRFGSFESYPIDMGGSFNTLRLNAAESNPGASQVFVWQNDKWQRIRQGEELILDMPGRMPLSVLKYKVNFAAGTKLDSIHFEWENKSYAPSGEEFSFIVVADTFQSGITNALRFGYETFPNLALIFHNQDMAGPNKENTYATTAAAWNQNPNFPSRYVPYFPFQGNHDIEVPRGVDFTVRGIGPRLSTALPGMRNFQEGPFDIYPNHDNYEDRNLQYSFEYGNSLFVVVNSYFHDILLDPQEVCDGACSVDRFDGVYGSGTKYGPQACISDASTVPPDVANTIDWLESLFQYSTATHKFLFYHEPAFPTPSPYHRGDSWDNANCPGNNRYAQGDYQSRPMRDKLWALFAKYNVTATFCGHEHIVHQSFVGDPSGQGSALYEIKPGPLSNVRNFSIVHVNGPEASIHQYQTTSGQFDFSERFEPLIVNRDPSQPNYPPKLRRWKLDGESFFQSDETAVEIEEGMSLGSEPIILEATDNNVGDEIRFTVEQKPSFLIVNNEGSQRRRISFSSDDLTAQDAGSHTLRVTASDGQATDSIEINITVRPALPPVVLGSFIKQGQSFANLQSVPFICRDQVTLWGWSPPAPVISIDYQGSKRRYCMDGFFIGQDEECGDVPGASSGKLGWYRYYNNSLAADTAGDICGTKGVMFRNNYGDASHVPPIPPDYDRPPGVYEVTNVCHDSAGHASQPFMVSFTITPDGLPIAQKPPWVVGTWPNDGAAVTELSRIWILIQSYNCCNHQTLSEIAVTKNGEPFQGFERKVIGDGIIELAFAGPAGSGTYQISITPKIATGSGSLTGTTYSAVIQVN